MRMRVRSSSEAVTLPARERDARSIMNNYFGAYYEFRCPSKKDAAFLLGADTLVGDALTLSLAKNNTLHPHIELHNKYQKLIGEITDEHLIERIKLAHAEHLNVSCLLSFVAYTDHPNPGYYWGHVALFIYDATHKAYETFENTIAQELKKGVRPDISLSRDGIQHVESSNGTWVPRGRIPLPKKEQGMALMKTRRLLSESLIEQGRAGNKGCYLVSWIFLLALVTLIILGIKSLGWF